MIKQRKTRQAAKKQKKWKNRVCVIRKMKISKWRKQANGEKSKWRSVAKWHGEK